MSRALSTASLLMVLAVLTLVRASQDLDCNTLCHGKWNECIGQCEEFSKCIICNNEKNTCLKKCKAKEQSSIILSPQRRTFVTRVPGGHPGRPRQLKKLKKLLKGLE